MLLYFIMAKKSISELDTLQGLEKLIRARERLEEWHIENEDFKQAMADKWAMAMLGQRGL